MAFLFRAWLAQRRRWLIRHLPLSHPRSLAMGPVGVVGRVELEGEPMLSPLFRVPCAWYRVRVAGWKEGRKVILRDEEYGRPFELADETGRVHVDPWGALIRGQVTFDQYYEPGNPAGDPLVYFLDRFQVPLSLAEGAVHVREWILPLGYEVYVLGQAGRAPDRLPPAEVRVKKLMKFWLEVPEHRAAIDMNQDGLIQAEEWDRALNHARDHVRLQDLAQAKAGRPLLLRKPPWGPFLITARGEKDALAVQGWPLLYLILGILSLSPAWSLFRGQGWPQLSRGDGAAFAVFLLIALILAWMHGQGRLHPASLRPWALRLDPVYGIMNSLEADSRDRAQARRL